MRDAFPCVAGDIPTGQHERPSLTPVHVTYAKLVDMYAIGRTSRIINEIVANKLRFYGSKSRRHINVRATKRMGMATKTKRTKGERSFYSFDAAIF